MNADDTFEEVQERLKQHGQGHLLAFWSELDGGQRRDLAAQIHRFDLSEVDCWVEKYVRNPAGAEISDDLAPSPFYAAQPATAADRPRYEKAVRMGEKLISEGKVAAFVVAGGQGTRLGFNGPKGDFPVSPIREKTLFQIFAETIAAASRKYHASCPWYIMTSPLNHARTREIFRDNEYYGLAGEDVFVFEQGTLPNFGFDGGILLADKATIACSPDGHGGSLKALHRSGAVADMIDRGIEFISYWQVDNPLINIFDPLFIGLHALDGAQMSSKALIKTGPFEKVGNFCLDRGRLKVIEYSDLPDDLAEKRNPDGSLVFELGSIAIHIINRTFVEQLNADGFSLPLHRAVKKIRHIDAAGNPVEADEPNGVKLESFVFDALPLAERSIILETIRSQEFAPTKNATGVDSAETTRRMMVARAADWLEAAGVEVPRRPDGSPDCLLEIAPSFALHKEDVREKADRVRPIRRGDTLYLD